MKILITGASSTLGKNLTSELLKTQQFSIRLLEHRSPVSKENCEVFQGGLQDIDSLSKACSGIDTVVHLAALTHSSSGKAYFEINEAGTKKTIIIITPFIAGATAPLYVAKGSTKDHIAVTAALTLLHVGTGPMMRSLYPVLPRTRPGRCT